MRVAVLASRALTPATLSRERIYAYSEAMTIGHERSLLALVCVSAALGVACDARPTTTSTTPDAGNLAAPTARDADAPASPSAALPTASAAASAPALDGDAGPDAPFRPNNNQFLMTGPLVPGGAVDNAKLRRSLAIKLAPTTKAFSAGQAFLLRPGLGANQVQKRIDGQSVVEMAIVVTFANTSPTPQCNIRVGAELRDAKGASPAGVRLREHMVLGDVGGFRNDPSKMTVIGASPGLNLNRNCLGSRNVGYAVFSGNAPLAAVESITAVEMSVDTWSGSPPPLVGPKTKVLPTDYAYAPAPANSVTINLRNAGTQPAAVKAVTYVMLDAHDEPLFVGWTSPTAANPAKPLDAVRLGPGETMKTDDAHNTRVAYEGRGSTRMLAWVDFVDAP